MPESLAEIDALDALAIPSVRARAELTTGDADALLTLARAHAPDPSIFDAMPPTFWRVEASSKVVDYYSTMMMDSTLKNYARDASDGVAFQDSHLTRGMQTTLGYSLRGEYKGARGDQPARTLIDFYTTPALTPTMREFVDRMRAGLTRDVSVGFKGGQMMCSICGKQMFRWFRSNDKEPCWHMPGVEYDLTDKDGNPTGKRAVAIGQIEDAGLGEVSAVHDGATPNAGILGLKARALAERGLLTRDERDRVIARYGLELPGGGSWPGLTTGGGRTMPNENERTIAQADVDSAVRDALTRERAESRQRLVTALQAAGRSVGEGDDLIAHIDALGVRVRELSAQADDGKQYRTDLISSTLEEGVRAFGKSFDEQGERTELDSLPLERVKARLERYQKLGDDVFGEGGRSTTAGDGKTPATPPVTAIGSRRRAQNKRIYQG
jgi:hypothetical protein